MINSRNSGAKKRSSVLYENASKTIFLLDIPSSIALAQDLRGEAAGGRCLLSSPPMRTPYLSSAEPATASARVRVLQRIPLAEQTLNEETIRPLVLSGLEEIREVYQGGQWCLQRCYLPGRQQQQQQQSQSQSSHQAPLSRETSAKCWGRDDYEAELEPPPVILSPSCTNQFESLDSLKDQPVINTSSVPVTLSIRLRQSSQCMLYTVPPLASFILSNLPTETGQFSGSSSGIPALGSRQFDLIVLDPPWSNRSVRRSRQYRTHPYADPDGLMRQVRDILRVHLKANCGVAAIWITNASRSRRSAYSAIQGAGLCVFEEWIWIKTTTDGEPVSPVDGIWRKPYEMLIIGRKPVNKEMCSQTGTDMITRRLIAAVPDVHSRKPNLKEVLEKIFFARSSTGSTGLSYSALEVFARNLTAGWWACGDEVLRFNADDWWTQFTAPLSPENHH